MDTKLIARYAIRETLGIVVMGVALFWSAGQIDQLVYELYGLTEEEIEVIDPKGL